MREQREKDFDLDKKAHDCTVLTRIVAVSHPAGGACTQEVTACHTASKGALTSDEVWCYLRGSISPPFVRASRQDSRGLPDIPSLDLS